MDRCASRRDSRIEHSLGPTRRQLCRGIAQITALRTLPLIRGGDGQRIEKQEAPTLERRGFVRRTAEKQRPIPGLESRFGFTSTGDMFPRTASLCLGFRPTEAECLQNS